MREAHQPSGAMRWKKRRPSGPNAGQPALDATVRRCRPFDARMTTTSEKPVCHARAELPQSGAATHFDSFQ